jgi:hypothetical protein
MAFKAPAVAKPSAAKPGAKPPGGVKPAAGKPAAAGAKPAVGQIDIRAAPNGASNPQRAISPPNSARGPGGAGRGTSPTTNPRAPLGMY